MTGAQGALMATPRGMASNTGMILGSFAVWVAAIVYLDQTPQLPADALLRRQVAHVMIRGYVWLGWLLPLVFAVSALKSRKARP